MAAALDDFIFRISNTKPFRVWKGFERDILRNLTRDGIETRPANTNGIWCCILVPLILVLYTLQYRVSLLYATMACISVGLLCYSVLFIIFMSVSCLVLKEDVYGGCTASAAVSAVLMYSLLNHGLLFSLIYSMLAVYLYSLLLRLSLTAIPKTFTIGEAMVVVQSVLLFSLMIMTRTFTSFGDKSDRDYEFVYNIVFTILSSVGIIIATLILDTTNTDLHSLYYIISSAGTYALVMLHILEGFNCIINVAAFVLLHMGRVRLFIFWAMLCVLAAAAILMRTKVNVKATTVTRKVFHILASLVFLSGIIVDLQFMILAAGAGLGLIVLMEVLRKSNIDKITPALEAAFNIFSDEKDAGYFAMTPIYLYAGLACPLVLVPVHEGFELELISGVLSLGIGDTAASWFGSKFGFTKWEGSNKSFEGTVCNTLSQILTVFLLQYSGLLNVPWGMLKTILAAIITGWVEAKTDQIDNLILPLFSIISFQLTWFLMAPLKIST